MLVVVVKWRHTANLLFSFKSLHDAAYGQKNLHFPWSVVVALNRKFQVGMSFLQLLPQTALFGLPFLTPGFLWQYTQRGRGKLFLAEDQVPLRNKQSYPLCVDHDHLNLECKTIDISSQERKIAYEPWEFFEVYLGYICTMLDKFVSTTLFIRIHTSPFKTGIIF